MPGIRSRLGDDIYDGTRIATVFRAELVGHNHVLLNEFGIAQEKAWTADAVVVVILPVDLLVVTTAAQAIDRESHTVSIRKVVATAIANSGDEQRKIVQSLVFLDAGKCLKFGSTESVRNLGLRCLDEGGCRCNLNCSRNFAWAQSHRTNSRIGAGSHHDRFALCSLEARRAYIEFVGSNRYQAQAEKAGAVARRSKNGSCINIFASYLGSRYYRALG